MTEREAAGVHRQNANSNLKHLTEWDKLTGAYEQQMLTLTNYQLIATRAVAEALLDVADAIREGRT